MFSYVEEDEDNSKGKKISRSTPKGLFANKDNRKWYIEWLCRKLNYNIPQDLNRLTQNDFRNNYGAGMLVQYYNTSVYKCLCDIYPEYEEDYLQWFMFLNKPKNSFNSKAECLRAMLYLRKIAGWQNVEDFYNLSRNNFDEYGLGQLIYYKDNKKKNFAQCIIDLNPDLSFDKSKFNRHKTEQLVQDFLTNLDFVIIPHFTIFTSLRGGTFKVDILLPQLNLIIEIDGPQHFNLLQFFQTNGYEINLNRDLFKAQEAHKQMYSVIRIIQEECWNGKEKWLQQHLVPLLKNYDVPTLFYLETTDKNKDIYKNHRFNENKLLNEDDLYPKAF